MSTYLHVAHMRKLHCFILEQLLGHTLCPTVGTKGSIYKKYFKSVFISP